MAAEGSTWSDNVSTIDSSTSGIFSEGSDSTNDVRALISGKS